MTNYKYLLSLALYDIRPDRESKKKKKVTSVFWMTKTCLENQHSKFWLLCGLKHWPLVQVGNMQQLSMHFNTC